MSFNSALKTLQASNLFKQFKIKNKKAILFSAFFLLNSNLDIETQQLDYFLGGTKVITFIIQNKKIEKKEDIINNNKDLSQLKTPIMVDIDKIKEIIDKVINEKALTEFKLNKVIAILQKDKDRQIWNITCFFDCLKILRLHIDTFTAEILKIKEESMVDFISFKK